MEMVDILRIFHTSGADWQLGTASACCLRNVTMPVSTLITYSSEPNQRRPPRFIVSRTKKISKNILFLHAVVGCETTSRLYEIEKGSSLRKFKTSNHFREQAKVFDEESASQEVICAAGAQALVYVWWEN